MADYEQAHRLIEEKQFAKVLEELEDERVSFLDLPQAEQLDKIMEQIPPETIKGSAAACVLAMQVDLRFGRFERARSWYSQIVLLRDSQPEGSRERSLISQYLCHAGLMMPNLDNAQILLRLAICCNEISGKWKLANPPHISITDRRPSVLRGVRDVSEWGKNYRAVISIIEPMLSNICGESGAKILSAAVAELLYEYNDLNAAASEAAASLTASAPEVAFAGMAQMIRLHQADGSNGQRLEDLFANIDSLIDKNQATELLPSARALRVRSALLLGDTEAAEAWLKDCGLGEIDLNPGDSYALITKAQALLATGAYRDALVLLGQIMALQQGDYRPLDTIECLALSAIACEHLGERNMALEKLENALALASQYRYIRVISDCGPVMAQLLAALRNEADRIEGIGERYLASVCSAAEQRAATFPKLFCPEGLPAAGGASCAETDLTATELQILSLLEEGKSNKDIASQLNIKVTTVKFHLTNVFEKLGVSSRTAAIKQAKGMGLLN